MHVFSPYVIVKSPRTAQCPFRRRRYLTPEQFLWPGSIHYGI